MNSNKLRGILAERNISQRQMAKIIGISEKTFYNKMKKGNFGIEEAQKMISILDIKNPIDIFFSPNSNL